MLTNVNAKTGNGVSHRYVFVGGLHRSGTSLVARLVEGFEGVAGIRNAPVPENEGVYLQGAIPHDALSGRPMHFATDPAQHLTETHPLNCLATRRRLDFDWDPWFAGPALWRVEKSPVNLTRMRLLQQLYPLAQFVIVLRHPEFVAAAVAKWVDRPASALIDHWGAAHRIVRQDIAHLHCAVVVRYEDLMADPHKVVERLARFLSVPNTYEINEILRDGNEAYRGSPAMSDAQGLDASAWGYRPGGQTDAAWEGITRHPLRSVRDAMSAVR